MNNKKFQAIENIVAATATYAKNLMDVEEVIKFTDIEKTCELLDIKEFLTNIQLIRAIINLKNNNNNDGGTDDEDVGVTPVATIVSTTPEIEKADESSREDIDLTCDFISYDKPHVVKHDQRVLNLMGRMYKTVRVSALDHLLLVRDDGQIFDYLGNQIVVSTYINGNGNKIKLTMPNGKLTHMSAIPIIADAWVEKKRKGDIYPRIVDTQKPATPDNIIWYDRKLGPVKVPPEYNVSTTPQSTTNWKYRHAENDEAADTEKKTKPAATPISYSIEYEIPVIRQLNRYRGSIKKVYDELKDSGSSVTLFDIFNIKEHKFGTTDDDLSVLVRDVVEECQYDMNRIGDLILKNTNKIISHTQRRLIRKLAKKAGVEAIEETEKFPEVKKVDQKNERELEIANVLKRLDWNILQAFLHMRATPAPATMFQIYKVKEKYYSTDESDVRAVAINIHRSMGISDWKKISDMLDNELGVTVKCEKIEQWVDNYDNYIKIKRDEAASANK